jgi:hypothetical protein
LYAVFDGHGGALASEFCAQELPWYVVGSEEGWEVATKAALKDAFMKTDAAFVKATEGTNRLDGTTALVALVRGTRLFVANAGDSRAILVQRGARVVPLSRDHKPSLPDELQRITEMGGKVIFWGRWRVEGILAVSRAIGDMHLKPYVTPEPEVTEWEVAEDDLFLILASDGTYCNGPSFLPPFLYYLVVGTKKVWSFYFSVTIQPFHVFLPRLFINSFIGEFIYSFIHLFLLQVYGMCSPMRWWLRLWSTTVTTSNWRQRDSVARRL